MYTHSKVVGSRLGASTSPTTKDPSGWHRELGRPQGARQCLDKFPESPSRRNQVQAGEQRTGAYTLITPNENRRNQIQRIAEKELENLEKWKEQHRAKPINLAPKRLGGSQSEAEVRQKQQLQLMQYKYQQKLKREESKRIKKEAEEAEIKTMKMVQREKSNKLEEKRLQENLRREKFRGHQQYNTAEFMSRLDSGLPSRNTCQVALPEAKSSPWSRSRAYKDSLKEEENRKLQKMKEEQHQKSELLEFKRQQEEEERIKTHQSEQRRVNNAFLDRLQGKSQPGGLEQFGGYWNMNSGNSWDF
ncbi:PREDICTED: epithelial-stromal interaction protein 1 [Condylura cristata]|uniref:epithelial-stromal interaction protein 1 n=1 Tax=Condylura cristata TaxID=143302 RepID=UPI0006437215|nr:PREDICTED: epithelial-stromal interaction protein 1 [Condylura cristata]